jgi:3'(2'), 5'-bisphosphate nucleotidase
VDDHELAADIAREAGELLLELQARRATKDEGDRLSNELILGRLAAARPDDAILSEESKDSPERLTRERVWIIDPLDGTREWGEGRTDWAVHVALAFDGVPRVSTVALPGQNELLSTAQPPQPPAVGSGKVRLLVSRTRPPAVAEYLADVLDAELVPMGSAGAKAMAVVQGHADVYAHSGGQYEWDSAAPVGVATAAGCHCSRIDGAALQYNRPDPYLPDLLICRADLATRVLDAVRAAPDLA